MALPIPTERQRLALAETVPPPANLRARVLARHRGRRIRRRAMRAVLPALLVLGLVLAPWAGRPGAGEPWRQAQAVEAVWRAEADFSGCSRTPARATSWTSCAGSTRRWRAVRTPNRRRLCGRRATRP